jgi:hypothetical protein
MRTFLLICICGVWATNGQPTTTVEDNGLMTTAVEASTDNAVPILSTTQLQYEAQP